MPAPWDCVEDDDCPSSLATAFGEMSQVVMNHVHDQQMTFMDQVSPWNMSPSSVHPNSGRRVDSVYPSGRPNRVARIGPCAWINWRLE